MISAVWKVLFPNRAVSDKGFTLVELLIAMAIGMVVLSLVGSIYTRMSMSFTTETARAGAQQDIRSGMTAMVQDIRLAGLDPLGSIGAGFIVADSDDIEFTADLNYDGVLDHDEQIRYFLEGTRLNQRLGDDADTDEVLLEDIAALLFEYNDGTDSDEVVITMTVEKKAGRKGRVLRTLTERVRIRNL